MLFLFANFLWVQFYATVDVYLNFLQARILAGIEGVLSYIILEDFLKFLCLKFLFVFLKISFKKFNNFCLKLILFDNTVPMPSGIKVIAVYRPKPQT